MAIVDQNDMGGYPGCPEIYIKLLEHHAAFCGSYNFRRTNDWIRSYFKTPELGRSGTASVQDQPLVQKTGAGSP